jgi:predicted secreted protein with PEFG-CTERM motif
LGRRWIDAKTGADGKSGDDDKYIIYIDGLEVPYQESSIRPESRLITIQFQEGDSDIEIIGTYVVPEFGPIAILILVVAVTSVLVLSKKSTFLRFN